jgi:hypothetical protein
VTPAQPTSAVGLQVTDDRVLIRPDIDRHAPRDPGGGVFLAGTLSAAVTGAETTPSWYTGHIVQVGPSVTRRNLQRQLAGWLLDLEGEGHDVTVKEICLVRHRVEQARPDVADPLRVGDRVAFSCQSGHQIAVDGVPYVLLRAPDVLAVIEEVQDV